MKKVLRSFTQATTIYLVILLLFLSLDILSHKNGFEGVNLKQSYLPPLAFLYLPIFIAFLFQIKIKNVKLRFVMVPLVSFFITYLFLYFLFNFIILKYDILFFNRNILVLSIISLLVSISISFILKINGKYNATKRLNNKVKYSNLVLLFIPILLGLFHFYLFFMVSSFSVRLWSSYIPIGVISSFFSMNFFNSFYNKGNGKKSTFFILMRIKG